MNDPHAVQKRKPVGILFCFPCCLMHQVADSRSRQQPPIRSLPHRVGGAAHNDLGSPHVAQKTERRSGCVNDDRTIRHAGYRVSQTKRKRVEEIYGWFKAVALLRKVHFRGLERVGGIFNWVAAAYNLVSMRNPLGTAT